MDAFEKKHEVVQQLLDLLKSNAVGEVEKGLHPKGVEVEKVSVIPHTHTESVSPEEASKLAEGGVVEEEDKNALEALPGPVEDEDAEKDAIQSEHNEEIMDEDEDNNQSAFGAFLKRKLKK